jgi:small subunit ribosomal protein S20
MPIIKSAKKRVKVSAKAATRNAKTKRTLREAVKSFHAALTGGKATEISAAQAKANSAIDTAAKKNVIHKNKAAHKKSQLATAAKAAGAKPAAAKKTTKPAAPKAATKKATAKPVAKKAAAPKKPAAKKATK